MTDSDEEMPDTADHKVRQVATFGRGTRIYDGVLTGDPFGHDHDLSLYAYYDGDVFEVTTVDQGDWPVDDLCTALWVEPEHIPDLLKALGAGSGDDPVELLGQHIREGLIPVKAGGAIEYVCIDRWFDKNGVPYTSASKSVSNK